jgi:dipeptidyl aminopeptidase/acylaminoacyl peptidase
MIGVDAQYLKAHGLERMSLAGFLPVSGQMITHSTVRRERGVSRSQPIIDDAAPAYHSTAETAPFLCIVGSNDLPVRAEENRFFVAAMTAAGHSSIRYLEVADRDHSTIVNRMDQADDVVAREMMTFINRSE